MIGCLDCIGKAVNKQVIGGDIQFVCHHHQSVETARLVCRFHLTHIGGRAINSLGKLHLSNAFLCAERTDSLPEKNVVDLHIETSKKLMFLL